MLIPQTIAPENGNRDDNCYAFCDLPYRVGLAIKFVVTQSGVEVYDHCLVPHGSRCPNAAVFPVPIRLPWAPIENLSLTTT